MATNAIKMHLDFVMNAGDTLKSMTKMTKGYSSVTAEINKVINSNNFMTKGMKTSIAEIGADTRSKLSDAFSYISSAMDQVSPDYFEDNMVSSMRRVAAESMKMSREMGHNYETAAAQAKMAVDAFQAKTESSLQTIQNAMTSTGLIADKAIAGGFAQAMTTLGEESPRKAAKTLEVLDSMQERMKNMNHSQMAKASALMNQWMAAVADGSMSADEFTKNVDEMSYALNTVNNRIPGMINSFKSLAGTIGSQFASVLGVGAVLDDAFSAQAQTVETVHRLALRNNRIFEEGADSARNFNSTVMDMNASVRRVGAETEISMTRASEAINSLAAARVPGTIDDLEQLAVTSVRMQQAFGMAEGQAADMIKTLSLSGNISPAGINAVGEALADVQAVWGMTSEEAAEAGATIGNVINRMSQMGANSIKNANIVAREVGRMTTAFTRAGMSASDATQMMDRFMDPTKLEDNALLWHSMGISVADGLKMMTGDASAMEGMTEKLMQTATNLRNEYGNNPLALQAMAEAHGMTIKQVNQLANEMEREANMTDQARDALEKQATLENQAAQARQSAAEALKRLAAIGNVLLQSFVMPLLDLLMFIVNPLMKVISGIQGFIANLERMGPAGEFIIGVLKGMVGAVLLFALATKTKLFKLGGGLSKLTNGFGGLFNSIKAGATSGIKAIGGFAQSIAKKLGTSSAAGKALNSIGDKLKGIGGKAPAAAGPAAAGPDTGGATRQGSKAMQGLAKIPAKNLMMLGAAMLMIAGAILLLAISFKVLVGVVQEASFGEIAVAVGLLVIIMGALIGMMFAMAAAAPATVAAGTAMLYFGAAMLLVGAAVSIIILSLALLMHTLKGMTGPEIIGGIIALVVVLGALIGIAVLMGMFSPVFITAGTALLYFGASLAVVAAAMLLFGLGIMLMGVGIKMIVESISAMGDAFLENAAALTAGVMAITPALIMLGAVGLAAAAGIVPLAIGLGIMVVSIAALVMLFAALGDNVKVFVDSLTYIGDNMFDVIKGFATLAIGMLMLGGVALLVGPMLLVAGAALILIGAGTVLVGMGLKIMNEALTGLAALSGQIIPIFAQLAVGLLALGLVGLILGPQLLMVGVAMALMGVGMMSVGLGLQIISKAMTTLSEQSDKIIPVFAALAAGMALLGVAAIFFGGPILVAAAALALMGVGMMAVGVGVNLLADGFAKLSELGWDMVASAGQAALAMLILAGALAVFGLVAPAAVIGMAMLGASVLVVGLAVVVFNALGNAFMKMGEGAQLFSNNLGTAVTNIGTLMSAMEGFRGMSKDFTKELEEMAIGFEKLGNGADISATAVQSIMTTIKAETDTGESNAQSVVVEHLPTISVNTERIAVAVEKMAEAFQNNGRSETFVASQDIGV